jgi:hypothetical protein
MQGFPLFGRGRILVAVILAVSLVFSGCDFMAKLGFGADDEDETEEIGIIPEAPLVRPATVDLGLLSMEGRKSIKAKFGIMTTGTQGVKDTFNTLHAFISTGGLADPLYESPVIELGDWIDLEAGLAVSLYGLGLSETGAFSLANDDIDHEGYISKWLRLIVVGINSFHSNRGVKDDNGTPTLNGEGGGKYKGDEKKANNGTQHVVFQFQNVLTRRRMDPDNKVGYPASEMRQYLVPVEGYPGSGKFLQGLTEAGVPNGVLWGPVRSVSTSNDETEDISDLLWLPTEREMFGWRGAYAIAKCAASETNENQARLEYYADDLSRVKYLTPISKADGYFLASLMPVSDMMGNNFLAAAGYGVPQNPLNAISLAPAFCVK